jgi:hypothetical protein
MSKMFAYCVVLLIVAGCANSKKSDNPPTLQPSSAEKSSDNDGFQKDFAVKTSDWASTGRNDYFVLEPGYQQVYRSDEGELIITVLRETKKVDGVETRVIEERESANGHPAEISRNFFAIDRATGDVYYFGEEVDVYKNDKVTSHPGGWLSGVNGAHYGLFMPAKPRVGQKFQQEYAPNQAMDRCEVMSVDEKLAVPLGNFDHCLKIKETTPLEPGKEYKIYAAKVGLLQDEELKLVKAGPK